MKKLLPLMPLMLVIFSVSLCAQSAYSQVAQMSAKAGETKTEAAKPEQKSLYERLGGYDAIAAVTDDFIGRLGKSKLLGRFVVGLSEDSKKKLRQHFVDFICNATGGPCLYIGRDMKTTHAGLGIDEKDWEEGVKLLGETLDHFKVPATEKGELVGAVASLKKDIVEKK